MAKVAIIHYSSTGNVHQMAGSVEQGAREAGAETRLLKVAELAPQEAIDQNEAWKAHAEATADVPTATNDDLEWADAYIFGSPTRYGNVSAQLKQFIDGAGPLWQEGKLADKVASGFTSSATLHGGQETTLLTLFTVFAHWGCVIVPPGYTHPHQFVTGNPYGASHVDGGSGERPSDDTLQAAHYQGQRVAEIAARLRD